MSNGWRAHPGAADDRPAAPPATPGRVVGVGALCELRPPRPGDHAETRSFTVSEFVTLADGRRVILHPTTATAADVIGDTHVAPPTTAACRLSDTVTVRLHPVGTHRRTDQAIQHPN